MLGFVIQPVLTMAEDEAVPDSAEAEVLPEDTATEPQATSTPVSGLETAEELLEESTGTSTPESTATSTPESSATSSPESVATSTPESTSTSTIESEFGLTSEEPAATTTPESAAEQNFSPLPASFSEVVDTSFTTGGSEALKAVPVVKAVWEMNGTAAAALGTDDHKDSGAQFLPSGQYRVSKPFSVCATVSDLNGAGDITSVEARIVYPQAAYYEETEEGELVCGLPKGTLKAMTPLAKEQGISLFCESIKNKNASLPSFYDIYNFIGLCGEDGELEKGTAAVYCADGALKYDDAAGKYNVIAIAKDSAGNTGNSLSNNFSYLELTAFETDFSGLDYGNAELNALKTIQGDEVWQEPKTKNYSTVRNVGNTRLRMSVTQDDMGLGKTDGVWNIRYGFKVGEFTSWASYWPEETMAFEKIIELSQTEPIDFALTVLNFSEDSINAYAGKMTLTAQKAEGLLCD